MPSPTVVSLTGFPAQLKLKRQGNAKLSPASSSGANIRAPLGGTVITRFSVAGTNLSFANGTQEIQDSRVFAPNTSQVVPLSNWSVQCPLATKPDPLIGLNVTAEYQGNPPSAAKTTSIVIIDAPALGTALVATAKAAIAKGMTVIGGAKAKRPTKKATPKKRAAKKRPAKKAATKRSSPRKASSRKPAAKRPAKKAARKSSSKRPR